jgi:hypothetical protein
MYTAASWSLRHAVPFAFMTSVARIWVWVGVAAWAVVVALMVYAFAGAVRSDSRRQPGFE